MGKLYNFEERLSWMRKQRTLLDANFYPRIAHDGRWVVMAGSRGSKIFDKNRHVDVTMMTEGISRQLKIKSGVYSLTIDEKLDSKNRSTIFFEEWSDKERKLPGWAQPGVSDADVLLWAFKRIKPPGLKVYMFWLPELIKWAWPRKHLYDAYPIYNEKDGREWTTWGYSIPIRGQASIPPDVFFGDPDGYLVLQQLDFSLLIGDLEL